MTFINLPEPHGYLIWKEKQSAVASNKELPAERVAVISRNECYGYVTLGKPVSMQTKEFDKPEWVEQHSVWEHERKILWPNIDSLFVHRIENKELFNEPRLVEISGNEFEFVNQELTEQQKSIVRKSKKLPKQITVKSDIVSISSDGQTVHSDIQSEELDKVLEAIYDDNLKRVEWHTDESLPLYNLALVRQPRFVIKAKADAPNYRESDTNELCSNCRFNDPEGNCELFNFEWDQGFICDAWKAIEVTEEEQQMPFKIVETDGQECVVNMTTGDSIMCYSGEGAHEKAVALMEMLQASEDLPIEEASTHLDENEKQFSDKPWDGSASRWETADAYCKDTLIDVNPSGQEKTKALCFLPFRDPGTTIPNQNAIQAAGGGRGVTRLKKPADVPQDKWNSQLKAAANKLIGWWPEAFDKPAPEGVFRAAGRERPEEKQAEKLYIDWKSSLPKDYDADKIEAGFVKLLENTTKENTDSGPLVKWFDNLSSSNQNAFLIELKSRVVKRELNTEEEDLIITKAELDKDEKAGRKIRGSIMEALRNIFRQLGQILTFAEGEPIVEEDEQMGLAMFNNEVSFGIKEINGIKWFFTWSTNAFQDREKEIFSTKALETYVNDSMEKEDKGFFNLWHIPGTDFAKKEWQAVVGRFLVEAGPFLDNQLGKGAEAFFSQHPKSHSEYAPEGWGCSPEFRFLPEDRKDGIYDWLWIVKTSVLPRAAAANIWTEANGKGVDIMALEGQQKELAVEMFGSEFVENLISEADKKTENLEQAGVAHKENNGLTKKDVENILGGIEIPDVDKVVQKATDDVKETLKPIFEQIGESLKKMNERLSKFEKQEEIKIQTETPRTLLDVYNRASQAEETVVAEDDKLLNTGQSKFMKRDGKADVAGAVFSGG